MATKLSKPVKRRWQALIVTVYPNGTLGLREFRRRQEHVVPLSRCFRLAVEMTIEAEKKARELKRAQARAEAGLPPRRRLVSRGLLKP